MKLPKTGGKKDAPNYE